MKLYQPPHRRNKKDSSNKDDASRERQAPRENRNGEINDLGQFYFRWLDYSVIEIGKAT